MGSVYLIQITTDVCKIMSVCEGMSVCEIMSVCESLLVRKLIRVPALQHNKQ